MKPLLTLILPLCLPLITAAQVASAPDIRDFTPAQVAEAINKNAVMAYGPVALQKIVAQALNIERLELIQACFQNPYTEGDTFRAICAMDDGDLRRKAAVMILRTKQAICFPDDDPLRPRSGLPPTGVCEPFITTVSRLLPGETLTADMVIHSKARFKLADRLYVAMQAKGVQFTDVEKAILVGTSPPASLMLPSAPLTPTNVPLIKSALSEPRAVPQASVVQLPLSAAQSQNSESKSTGNWVLWVSISGIVAFGLWLGSRNK